jgi:hypothetical protein
MRYMMIVKHNENQGPPPKALIDAIIKLSEDAAKSGTLVSNGGLRGTGEGVRVRVAGGKVNVIDGPFTEAKEIIGGFAIFDLKSRQEAIDGAVRFMELHKQHWPGWEGETEVRPMMDPMESCTPDAEELAGANKGVAR